MDGRDNNIIERFYVAGQWYYSVTIILCGVALLLAYKKKPRKSFEIILMNLFVQNILYLISFAYVGIPNKTIQIIFHVINACLYYLQGCTVVIVTIHRLIMLSYPLKANLLINKNRTKIAIAIEYIAVFSTRGSVAPALQLTMKLTLSLRLFGEFIIITLALVIITSNAFIIYKLMISEKFTRKISTTHRRKSNRSRARKAVQLLLCISFSFIIAYVLPIIAGHAGLPKNLILSHVLWIDGFINALSYILITSSIAHKFRPYSTIAGRLKSRYSQSMKTTNTTVVNMKSHHGIPVASPHTEQPQMNSTCNL